MYGITEICIEYRQIHHVARESGFHCMSPVVASRSFLGMPSASTLTRRPAPGLLRLGFRAGNDVQLKTIKCCLTTGQFAGTSDNFLRGHFQGGSQSKQGVQGGISQASLDKSHGLPVNTRLLSEQIQGNTAFLPFCFQQAGDLRTDGFRHSVDWHTEAIQKIWLTIDATLVAYHQNTSFPRRKIGEGLNEARVTESIEA